MENNTLFRKEVIIVVAVVVVILGIIIFNQVTKVNLTYATGKCTSAHESVLIGSYSELQQFVEDTGKSTIEVNHKKSTVTDVYNEEYFKDKKLGAIVTYENDSKEYIFSVDDLKYDGNVATITYTDKTGGYLGPLGTSWYNVMLVELKGSVTSANFVKGNTNTETN